ncbi:MAG: DMT family transporter [Bacillota bacterium]|nr:DMT family transporter [Bacillota bacterium]
MKKAYYYVLLTALLFSTMEVACKVAGNDLDPFQLTFLRFLIGGIVLLPFGIVEMKHKNIKLDRKDLLKLLGIGTIGIPISMVLFQIGIMNCNASSASVMFSINPLFTMVCAHLLTSEKVTKPRLMALSIGIIGLIFIIRPWDVQEGNSAFGTICLLLAAVTFGFYTVTGKMVSQKIGSVAQASISFLLGSGVLLIVITLAGKPVFAGVAENIPIVLYTGIFITGLGYYAYFTSIKLADATTGSFAFFLKPAIAPIIAVIVLKETILWNTFVGIGFILLASYLNIKYQQKANEIKKRFENQQYRKNI